jgi:carbamoyl-phosphate synthase large subunit
VKDKRIFISGGAGVIGRELVPKLHSAGAVLLVGDLKPRPTEFHPDVQYRQGDLNYITAEETELFKPDVFIHLAATFERSTETYEFWEENFWHNVRLSHYLMTLLKDSTSLKRVVFPSSYLIYNPEQYSFDKPQDRAVRLKESDRVSPRNLTGGAKLIHENELNFLRTFKGEQFSSVSLRIFRGYGRGSRCVISRWVRALIKGETIKVYRKEGLFDYIFAGDVAHGIIKVLDHPELTGIANLGNDNARRVEEVVAILQTHFPDMRVEEGNSDIPYEASQANMDLFREKTGWIPQMQLEETIPLIIDYEKNRAGGPQSYPSNVLITSASAKIPLIESVQKSIRKIGTNGKVFAGDISVNSLAAHFADSFWKMPPLDQLSLESLVRFCRQNDIKAIIPTRDGELEYFAEWKETLASEEIGVMISDKETVVICIDKLKFHQHAEKSGLPSIPTFLRPEDIQADALVVKERFGAGSGSLGIKLSQEEAIQHAKRLKEPIYQPFIEGREISVDMYVDRRGAVRGVVMRTRDEVIDGESRVTTTFYDDDLEKLCRTFVDAFSFYGHIILQVISDADGNYQIIECNPRFGGASSLSVFVGLDSFYWFLLESRGVDISGYPFVSNANRKVKQVRYPEDKHFIVQ